MPQTLYFSKLRFVVRYDGSDEDVIEYKLSHGIQPRNATHETANNRISLKRDLKWEELANLQMVMRSADFWSNFPEPNLCLITAEVKAGTESQRIDLLYIDLDDGKIVPCELKVGGDDKDSHGQLIRYIADLDAQAITKEWVIQKRREYLVRRHTKFDRDRGEPLDDEEKEERARKIQQNVKIDLGEFEEKISKISSGQVKFAPGVGIIVDEGFPTSVVRAVRYLNNTHAMNIRLISVDAFGEDDWNLDQEEYFFRLEFNDVHL